MINLEALQRAWCPATAYKGEGLEGSPVNQCLPTALLVQDLEGGFIWECFVGRHRHFYNTTEDGRLADYTMAQFDLHALVTGYTEGHVVDRKKYMRNGIKERYELLKGRYGT